MVDDKRADVQPSAPPAPGGPSGVHYPTFDDQPPPYSAHTATSVNTPGYPPYPTYPNQPPQIGFAVPSTPYPPVVSYAPGTTITVQPQQAPISPRFGTASTFAYCATCNRNIHTRPVYTNGACTYLTCSCLFIFGFYLCCCFIPFCCNSCKDVSHECKTCGRTVGVYRRL